MSSPTWAPELICSLVHDPATVIYGRLPRYRLDPVGRNQAEAAAARLRGEPITQVFSSPLLRARQTAQIISAALPRMPLRISELLHEIRTPFQGLPRQLGEARLWDLYSGAGPEYEQPWQVLDRGLRFVARVRRRYPGQQVVAVTHGDVVAFLVLWAHGAPPEPRKKGRFFPAPASISTFTFCAAADDEAPGFTYEVPY